MILRGSRHNKEKHMKQIPDKSLFENFQPTSSEIENLIAAAHNHPLGIEFLLQGDLCAVASTFRAHAFTVEAARDHWKESNS